MDIAYYFYEGTIVAWNFIYSLPWPTWSQYFGTMVLFIVLSKPRKYIEKKMNQLDKKKSTTPHSNVRRGQVVSAVVGSMIQHR